MTALSILDLVRVTPDLGELRLFLAAWGYNTLEQRATAGSRGHVRLMSLRDFAAPFADWPR